MYCRDCGTELSDEANFCSKCGKPQKPGAAPASPAAYELCDTRYKFLGGKPISIIGTTRVAFFAEAVCPKKGRYVAAESPEFKARKTHDGRDVYPDFGDQNHQPGRDAAFAALIAKLLADGWERTQTGSDIYRQSFRRLVQ